MMKSFKPHLPDVAYLLDNTTTYKKAFTRTELELAVLKFEAGYRPKVITIDIDSAIKEVLKEYWDSLGIKK